jgi:hypothetical protein
MTRRLSKSGDEQVLARLDGLGPAISRTRSWRTRAELGGRTLMLWQIVAADGSGRAAGSTIVPVTIPDGRRLDDEEMLARVNRAADAWRQRAARRHHAFISTRLAREHAVDGGRVLLDPARSADLFQPGLFERRGARAHSAALASQDAIDRDRAERMTALNRALAISCHPPQLLLVLTP